jgi:hypothetical protein
MPRPLGVLLIAAASLLFGVYAWFGLVWLLSAAAKLTDAPALVIAMFVLAPHMAGWLVALAFGVIAFAVGFRLARRCRLSWLGFGSAPASGRSPADEASLPQRPPNSSLR